MKTTTTIIATQAWVLHMEMGQSRGIDACFMDGHDDPRANWIEMIWELELEREVLESKS